MTAAAAVTETVIALTGAALGPFPTVWPYEQPGDVHAWLDLGCGFEPLDQGGDYSLSATNPAETGGAVLLSAGQLPAAGAWPPGAELALVRRTASNQPDGFGDASNFDPAISEAALDHVERQVQDRATQIERTWRMPFGEAGVVVPAPAVRAGCLFFFDWSGVVRLLPVEQLLASYRRLVDCGAITAASPTNQLSLITAASPINALGAWG